MKLGTDSFTFASPSEVAGMRCGCSEERSLEVCVSEDVGGDSEKPPKVSSVSKCVNRTSRATVTAPRPGESTIRDFQVALKSSTVAKL